MIIVGAGIVGLAHAVEARRRGLSVRVIDRDARAVGASVRNFGHCCLSAQPSEHDALVAASRQGWLAAAEASGLPVRTDGGLVVARSGAQLMLLEEFAAARPDRARLLTAAEVADAVRGGAEPGGLVGGLALTQDLRVDPRITVGRLADWLAGEGVRFDWRTACLGAADGVVHTTRGELRADRVLVCVGHDVDLLWPEVADAAGIQRCGLQMALVDQPEGLRTHAAVLTATSMLRYGGLAAMPAATEVRAEVTEQVPELLEMVANVMLAPRPDGSLLVGDSHVYDLSLEPFLDEEISDRLLREIAAVLGVERLRVRQRWQGVYASSAHSDLLVEHADARTTIVSVTCGVGMTLSFGLARRVLDEFGV
ncbi:TIGR03364 family FAD-dependent oxidoreductase [Enemella dayhoffiae]|uniref:TIGR03364 family FAD-dependent oxidoreductase n=1 Tax=Enemella dayhoffiae TaxID=2016507 RepID=A0A255HC47_9ACTN|nr:TIGR03364 family FAD-dependent oxidoreductase [Enemella dayhoffiae]